MSPLEFMQRLAALVRRPRLQLIRCHGVLAPSAKLRALVVPQDPEPPAQVAPSAECETACALHRPARLSGAKLHKRVCEIDMAHCPNCGGELKIIAVILEQPVIEKIPAPWLCRPEHPRRRRPVGRSFKRPESLPPTCFGRPCTQGRGDWLRQGFAPPKSGATSRGKAPRLSPRRTHFEAVIGAERAAAGPTIAWVRVQPLGVGAWEKKWTFEKLTSDAYAGEPPITCVELHPGAQVSVAERLRYAAGRIPERPAVPKEIIVLDKPPLTAVGKPIKHLLQHDTAKRVFNAALQELPRTWELEVFNAGGSGLRITLSLHAAQPQTRQRADEILSNCSTPSVIQASAS